MVQDERLAVGVTIATIGPRATPVRFAADQSRFAVRR